MTNPASGDDAARVERVKSALLAANVNALGLDNPEALATAAIAAMPVPTPHDLLAKATMTDLIKRLRAEGVLAYQNGYDHGADKYRSALEVERQIAKAKDAEITALRKALAQQVAK